VRYDQVNAMLLNAFLKEHQKVQRQEATIAQLKTTLARQEVTIARQQKRFDQQEGQIQAITSDFQRLSAQIEVREPAAQMGTDSTLMAASIQGDPQKAAMIRNVFPTEEHINTEIR